MYPFRQRARFLCPTRGRHAQFDACQPSSQPSATCTHPRNPFRVRPHAILVRASILSILHSLDTPLAPDTRRTGTCRHPPPSVRPHALPPSPRERLYFLHFTRSIRRRRQTHEGRGRAATPPPSVRPARPPAIAARASTLSILHSLDTPQTPDARRAGNGPSHSPPPLRVQLIPLARQGLRSA